MNNIFKIILAIISFIISWFTTIISYSDHIMWVAFWWKWDMTWVSYIYIYQLIFLILLYIILIWNNKKIVKKILTSLLFLWIISHIFLRVYYWGIDLISFIILLGLNIYLPFILRKKTIKTISIIMAILAIQLLLIYFVIPEILY